jgi:hypothetical protein
MTSDRSPEQDPRLLLISPLAELRSSDSIQGSASRGKEEAMSDEGMRPGVVRSVILRAGSKTKKGAQRESREER